MVSTKDLNLSGSRLASGRLSPLASLLPLYVVIFVGFVGYSLMITVFTPMMMRSDSAFVTSTSTMAHRSILLGVLLCLCPLGQFAGSPIMGSFSDRWGRKPILLISLSVTTSCYALIAAALMIGSFALFAAASLLAGLAEANIVTAQSAIADVASPDERNRFFGYIYMTASTAYVVGPLVGGKLADPMVVHWFNYAAPFWAVCLLLVLTTVAAALFFRETNPPAARRMVSCTRAFTNIGSVFTDRRLRTLYWLNFLFYLAIFGFFRCYPMYLVDEFHLGVSRVSEFVAWVGVPIVLANLWLTSFLSTRFGVKRLAIWFGFLTGLFMLIVVLPRELNALWITLFLTSTMLALCLPSCATLLSVTAGEGSEGQVMGNNQALQVGGEALSGLIGGLLAAIMVKMSLIVLAVIAMLAAVFLKISTRLRPE
jgi:MFS family permease